MPMNISFAGYSFIGRRKNNQDSIIAEKINEDTWLFAVADGMGGAEGGEVASSIVISTLKSIVEDRIKEENPDLKEILFSAYTESHNQIQQAIEKEPELSGMGTTLVCLLIHKNKYVWANLGDSRMYLFDSEETKLMTEDHTYIQEFINKNGNDIPQEFINQYSHLLTKSLDGNKDGPDIFPKEKEGILKDGQVFLLCSDGLINDKVNTNTNLLRNYVFGCASQDDSAKNLTGHAFHEGSNDNISVVLVDVGNINRTKRNVKQYQYLPSDDKKEEKSGFIQRIFKRKK